VTEKTFSASNNTQDFTYIEENVKLVKHNIEKAAIKVGKKPSDITLIGVTKTQSAAAVRALIKAGVSQIGENRVSEILEKEAYLSDLEHKTHMIGHLQRNKIKMICGHIDMLQSVDNKQTIDVLNKVYEQNNAVLDVLLEVNIGDEVSKSGIALHEAEEICHYIAQSKFLHLRGLMAIPPIANNCKVSKYFAQMYSLFVDIKGKKMDNVNMDILSMGMSSDYEIGIYEGATMVRVGSALFGLRK
jgi:pyridoxal phosphate enzyme (YggS family)